MVRAIDNIYHRPVYVPHPNQPPQFEASYFLENFEMPLAIPAGGELGIRVWLNSSLVIGAPVYVVVTGVLEDA